MSGSIRLSRKYGVNPSLLCCPLCMKDTGVALLGLINKAPDGDVEAPRKMRDQEPCDECKELMAQGILFIERDGDYLSGAKWVVKREVIEEWAKGEEFWMDVYKRGVTYIEPDVAKQMGFYAALEVKADEPEEEWDADQS